MNINTSFSPAVAYSRLATASQQPVQASNVPTDSVTLSGAEEPAKETRLSRAGKGALIGGMAGLILPGIIVPLMGFAASPITGPLGAVMGAFAGAVSFEPQA